MPKKRTDLVCELFEIKSQSNGDIAFDLDDASCRLPTMLDGSELFSDPLVLNRESGDGPSYLPEGRSFSKSLEVNVRRNYQRQEYVAHPLPRRPPQRPPCCLNDVNHALLRI